MKNFCTKAVAEELLYFIGNEEMVASVPSKVEGEVVCLWSSLDGAEKALKRALSDGDWEEYQIVELPLEEALFYLLPSMEENDLILGLDWGADLKGEESSCEEVILGLEKVVDEEAGRRLQAHLQESHNVWVAEDPDHPEALVHLAARSSAEGALAVWTDEEVAQRAMKQSGWETVAIKTLTADDFRNLARGKVLAIDWIEGSLTPEATLG